MVCLRNAVLPFACLAIFAVGAPGAEEASDCNADEVSLLQADAFKLLPAKPEVEPAVTVAVPVGKTSAASASIEDICWAGGAFVVLILAAQFGYPALRKADPSQGFSRYVSPYIAEFLGTFVLVFTVGCCIHVGNATWNALAIASVLMVMIYSTAAPSGGNLNPAVSFALWLADSEAMPMTRMLGYWCVQLLGGVSAGVCFGIFLSGPGASVEPGTGFSLWHACIAEAIYTFMLCFVVLNCATVKDKTPNNYFGLAIGFVIVAGGYAAGSISGAAFNPAVAMGIASSNPSFGNFANAALWAVFQLAGALTAAVLFKIVRGGGDAEASTQAKLISEFLGTFMLVLTVGLNVITIGPATALSAAMALMCMIYALGDVSGAHFNPAVTLAAYLRGALKSELLMPYILVQVLAGTCAGAVYALFHMTGPNKDMSFGLKPGLSNDGTSYPVFDAGLAELFATTVLAYVVLSVATVKETNDYFGLAIGSCVIAGGFAIGGVSGGELNPAVSIGISGAHSLHTGSASVASWGNCLVFSLFQLMGGIIAAGLFHLTHPKEVASGSEELK